MPKPLKILKKIGLGLGSALGVVGGGGSVSDKIGRASEIIDRHAPGIGGKHEMIKELIELQSSGQDSARAHDQPQNSGVPIIDSLVNGVNRCIRPGVTIGLIGALMGWWEIPDPETLHPRYWDAMMLSLGFWFGGRAVFSDLPKAIKYLKGL